MLIFNSGVALEAMSKLMILAQMTLWVSSSMVLDSLAFQSYKLKENTPIVKP